MNRTITILLWVMLMTLIAHGARWAFAEPFLTCDPPTEGPVVEEYLITGDWTGSVRVTAPLKFDLATAPIGANRMTLSACTSEGCSFPREFTLYKTKGWAFTKDKKTYTMKEQWVVREGGVILQ